MDQTGLDNGIDEQKLKPRQIFLLYVNTQFMPNPDFFTFIGHCLRKSGLGQKNETLSNKNAGVEYVSHYYTKMRIKIESDSFHDQGGPRG